MKDFSLIRYPELVFGIAGPIGIEIDELCDTLKAALHRVGYSSVIIRVTDEIAAVPSTIPEPKGTGFHSVMRHKMAHANAICSEAGDAARLMRYVIEAIRRERAEFNDPDQQLIDDPAPGDDSSLLPQSESGESIPFVALNREDVVRQKVAYIVRQIKRPAEIDLLRNVYNEQFVLISAYGAEADRRKVVEDEVRRTARSNTSEAAIAARVQELLTRDQSEDNNEHGQKLREAFHRADVFVDGISKSSMEAKITRFINALFGANDVAPTKSEYGMFTAASAALRSSDLSRQVGAALLTDQGKVLAQGCNEVPKAFGGTYWDTEEPDFRDVKLGSDPNERFKQDILKDLIEKMEDAGLLSEKALSLGKDSHIATRLLRSDHDESGAGCLNDSKISDLTEYGRVVHAEMNTICDAARIGRAIAGSVLYCTTFPCHNCTKHILASGIKQVFFMEPYPKSKAKQLHHNEVELEKPSSSRVSFMPFMGVAPNRYKAIFKKAKRKSGGVATRWYHGDPCPMIDVLTTKYLEIEKYAIAPLIGTIVPGQDAIPAEATGPSATT